MRGREGHGEAREKNKPPYWIPPFTEESTVEDVMGHDWPDPSRLDFSQISEECEKYQSNYATFGAPWSPFFHDVGWMIGQESFLVWMHTKPAVLEGYRIIAWSWPGIADFIDSL